MNDLTPMLVNFERRQKAQGFILMKWLQSSPCTAGTVKDCEPKKIPANYDFIVDEIEGSLLLATTAGSAIVGSELNRDALATIGSNTFPHINTILLDIGETSNRWTDEAAPFGLICGRPGYPKPLGTRQVLRANQQLFARLDNQSNVGTSVSVYGYILLRGTRVYL